MNKNNKKNIKTNSCNLLIHYFKLKCDDNLCLYRNCSKERHVPYKPCNSLCCKMKRLQNMYDNNMYKNKN